MAALSFDNTGVKIFSPVLGTIIVVSLLAIFIESMRKLQATMICLLSLDHISPSKYHLSESDISNEEMSRFDTTRITLSPVSDVAPNATNAPSGDMIGWCSFLPT